MRLTHDVEQYLIDRFDLDGTGCIRVRGGEVHCLGKMPNSTQHGWFFAGYVNDVKNELQRCSTWTRHRQSVHEAS